MRAPLPDVVPLVVRYLLGVPELVELVEQRVYSAYPAQLDKGSAFVLVQRIGGEPLLSRPLVLDVAVLQLDAVGGGQKAAHELAATCRAALEALAGEQPNGAGNVADVTFGPLRYVPDSTWKPPRPRYVADLSVTVKTSAMVLAGAH